MITTYINPLVVLELENADADSLKKAKRRKLMEFELAENGLMEINKQKISKNDFLIMLELLDTPQNIEFFALLKNEGYLLEAFLSSGDVAFFSLYNPLPAFKKADFLDFVRPFYLPQFDKTLLKTYKDDNHNLLKLLFNATHFISNKDVDTAYKGLYQHINQQIKSLEEFAPEIKKTNSKYSSLNLQVIFEAVAKLVKPAALNVLPDFFQSQRNNIGSTINQIGAITFNKHEDFDTSFQLFYLAKKLKIGSQQSSDIDKNIATLEANQRHRPDTKNTEREQREKREQQQKEQQKREQAQKEQQQKEQQKREQQRNKTQQATNPVRNYDEARPLLIRLNNDLRSQQITPAQALTQLTASLNFTALNALPNDLPNQYDWRDELARLLLDLAKQAHSQYNDKENALQILALASRLTLQPNMAKTIAETQLQWLRKKGSTTTYYAPPTEQQPPQPWQPPTSQPWQPPWQAPPPQYYPPERTSAAGPIAFIVIVGLAIVFMIYANAK
jgi:hypothetical protein